MKKTNFIIVSGFIILIIFSTVLAINLMPNYESNSYFVKVGEMNAKIESIDIQSDHILITTSGEAEYCIKKTRSTPDKNALCFKKIENNEAYISIIKNRKYYIWIKDNEGNISDYLTINAK